MTRLPPFKGTVPSPQFNVWLAELVKVINPATSTIAPAATDLPTALTLLNQLRAILVANGSAK